MNHIQALINFGKLGILTNLSKEINVNLTKMWTIWELKSQSQRPQLNECLLIKATNTTLVIYEQSNCNNKWTKIWRDIVIYFIFQNVK